MLIAAINAPRELDYYEITVSLAGAHVFSTAPRSARNKREAKRLQDELRKRFPKSEGFEVDAMRWTGPTYAECSGEIVSL